MTLQKKAHLIRLFIFLTV